MGFVALCSLLLPFLAICSAEVLDICHKADLMTVPPTFSPTPLEDFPFIESGLQIFTDLTIQCDGQLTEWRFLSRNNLVMGLHLGVFRWITPQRMQLAAESHIESLYVNRTSRWQRYLLKEPISVNAGDMLGMFYDSFFTLQEMLAIPSKGNRNNFEQRKPSKFENPPSIVLTFDNSQISKSSEINVDGAPRDYRVPALTAIIVPGTPVNSGEVINTSGEMINTSGEVEEETPPTPVNHIPNEIIEDHPAQQGGEEITTPRTRLPPPEVPVEPFVQAPPVEGQDFRPSFTQQPTVPHVYFARRCFNPPTALQTCSSMSMRSFFDYYNAVCKTFYGCNSPVEEANNFASAGECNAQCSPIASYISNMRTPDLFLPPNAATPPPPGRARPTPSSSLFQVGQRNDAVPNYCYDAPSSLVTCTNIGPRYYYDITTKQCYSFYGCSLGDRLGNNFDTVENCQQICRATSMLPYWRGLPSAVLQSAEVHARLPSTPAPSRDGNGRFDRDGGLMDPFAMFMPRGLAGLSSLPKPITQRSERQNAHFDNFANFDNGRNRFLNLDDMLTNDRPLFDLSAGFAAPGVPRPVVPFNDQQQQQQQQPQRDKLLSIDDENLNFGN